MGESGQIPKQKAARIAPAVASEVLELFFAGNFDPCLCPLQGILGAIVVEFRIIALQKLFRSTLRLPSPLHIDFLLTFRGLSQHCDFIGKDLR